jgi:hypothetical protein
LEREDFGYCSLIPGFTFSILTIHRGPGPQPTPSREPPAVKDPTEGFRMWLDAKTSSWHKEPYSGSRDRVHPSQIEGRTGAVWLGRLLCS